MKKLILNLVLSFLAITLFYAQADEFKLQVDSSALSVISSSGARVEEIPQGTVGKQISIGNSDFLISFGKDVHNNLSAIVSPVLDKHSPLAFTTLNKSIKTDGNAIVTIHYASDLASAQIDEGFIGKVQVAEVIGYAPTVPAKETTNSTPYVETKKTQTPSGTAVAASTTLNRPPERNSDKKDVFDVLKSDGIKGLFDTKNIDTNRDKLESLGKSQPTLAGSITSESIKNSADTTPVGKLKSIPAEKLTRYSQDKVGDIRLVSIQGNVTVDGKPAQEDAVLTPQSVIRTDEKGSAVVMIGGIHLLSMNPKTEVAIAQSLKEKSMDTTVDLKSGIVFADVNKREGYTQDFKIKTANGVASATGSRALVSFANGKFVVVALESRWRGRDASGKEIFNMAPLVVPGVNSLRTVTVSSIPATGGAELQTMIREVMLNGGSFIVKDTSRGSNPVFNPVASFVEGNALTLPDGRTNPGATLEGSLRNLIATIITDNLESEDKDSGDVLLVGDKKDPNVFKSFLQFENGRNGQQPRQTTPGGI